MDDTPTVSRRPARLVGVDARPESARKRTAATAAVRLVLALITAHSGHTLAELALITGVSERTVRRNLRIVRRELRIRRHGARYRVDAADLAAGGLATRATEAA